MKFLGIRDGHDCNVTYTDGTKVRYIKFERNLQKKHYNWEHEEGDHLSDLLKRTKELFKIDFDDLDAICFSYGNVAHQNDRDIMPDELMYEVDKSKDNVWNQFNCPVWRGDHHYTHAMSCWPLVDLDTVKTHFVVDGLGDQQRNLGIFQGENLVDFIDRMENMGLSINLESIGQAIGMNGMVLDISGKVMALKSYHGVPPELTATALKLSKYFKYRHLDQYIQICKQLQEFINPAPSDQEKLINMAYLLHVFAEKKMPSYFGQYADYNDVITYSGGTAQNTVINTEIKKAFPNSHIPPHCYDGGLSLGCVEILRRIYDQPKFDNSGFPFWQSDEAPSTHATKSTIEKAAEMLANGKIVGWYQGNGEIGPRALGNRSILMDPSIKNGKDTINTKVKKREPYRPFGASVLAEKASNHFNCDFETPYMLHVVDCLNQDFPSIMHVDGTCRIQTVNEEPQYEIYRDLISSFEKKTGIPMVLNTSLNVDGRPIAGQCSDAKELFNSSDLDAIVIGNEIMVK